MDINEMNNEDQNILRRRLKERRLFLNMTYQELADKTGISKSSLQRYENGGIKRLPYDKIFKLSESLEVTPSYFTDLSKDFTGEIDNSSLINKLEDRTAYLNMIETFEQKALQQIAPNLISNGYSVEQRSHGTIGDLVAIKGNETWHLDFLYTRDVSNFPTGIGMGKQQLILRFGRLSVYDKPITKYSIVMKHSVVAQQFLRFKPIHLDVEISIIVLKNDGYEELFFK